MEDSKVKITVRQSSGDQFEVEIKTSESVMELKKACAEKQTAMAAEEMRLIFKGKILKDEMTLDEYKITDGMTIHLVKGKTAGGAQPAATASDSGASASTGAGAAGAGAGIGLGAAGGAQPNPFAAMGGAGGNPYAGMGGMGGFGGGGMPPGMGMPGGQMPSP